MKIMGAFLMLLLTTQAWAEPMRVDADQFVMVQGEQRAEFVGNVLAVRGEMQIQADKMTLWYSQNDAGKKILKSAKAQGHVQINTAENEGSADMVSFDVGSDVLVLKGKAMMKSAQGTIEGEHITYNMRNKDTQVVKGEAEQQVRFIFDDED